MDEVREISETIDVLVRAKRYEHECLREPEWPDLPTNLGWWQGRSPAQIISNHILENPLGAAVRAALFALGVRLAEIGGGELMHDMLGAARVDDVSTSRSAALTQAWAVGIPAWDNYRMTQMETVEWLRHEGCSSWRFDGGGPRT